MVGAEFDVQKPKERDQSSTKESTSYSCLAVYIILGGLGCCDLEKCLDKSSQVELKHYENPYTCIKLVGEEIAGEDASSTIADFYPREFESATQKIFFFFFLNHFLVSHPRCFVYYSVDTYCIICAYFCIFFVDLLSPDFSH